MVVSSPETPTKPSDFKDIKTILDICGPLAIENGNDFKSLVTLIIYILYNFLEKPREIGFQLKDIIQEVHDQENEWFYRDWMDGLERKNKTTIEIFKEVAEKTKKETCCNHSDAACYMAVVGSHELMEIILWYYQNGEPHINVEL